MVVAADMMRRRRVWRVQKEEQGGGRVLKRVGKASPVSINAESLFPFPTLRVSRNRRHIIAVGTKLGKGRVG